MSFPNFRPICRFFNDGICVCRFVHVLRRLIQGPFLGLCAYCTFCIFVRAFCVLSVGYEGCICANVRRFRCVLPAFLVPTTLSINVYRFVCCGRFKVWLGGNVGVRFFRFLAFMGCLFPESGERSFRRDGNSYASIHFGVACLCVCAILRRFIDFLRRAVAFPCANCRSSVSFGLSAP